MFLKIAALSFADLKIQIMITFPCYNKIKEQYDLFLAVYRYDYAKLILLVRMGLGFEYY